MVVVVPVVVLEGPSTQIGSTYPEPYLPFLIEAIETLHVWVLWTHRGWWRVRYCQSALCLRLSDPAIVFFLGGGRVTTAILTLYMHMYVIYKCEYKYHYRYKQKCQCKYG